MRNCEITRLKVPILYSPDPQPAQHSTHGRLHRSIHFAGSFVDSGENQILQHLHVTRLHRLRIDTQAQQLLAAIHFRRNRAAARRGLDHRLLHLLLQGFILRLGLRHQFLQIESTHKTSRFKVSKFKVSKL